MGLWISSGLRQHYTSRLSHKGGYCMEWFEAVSVLLWVGTAAIVLSALTVSVGGVFYFKSRSPGIGWLLILFSFPLALAGIVVAQFA